MPRSGTDWPFAEDYIVLDAHRAPEHKLQGGSAACARPGFIGSVILCSSDWDPYSDMPSAAQAESVLQTDEWAWLRSPRFSAIGEKLLCSAKPRLFDRRRSAQRLEGVFAPKYVMAGVETN